MAGFLGTAGRHVELSGSPIGRDVERLSMITTTRCGQDTMQPREQYNLNLLSPVLGYGPRLKSRWSCACPSYVQGRRGRDLCPDDDVVYPVEVHR